MWRCLISTDNFHRLRQQLRERLPQPGAGKKVYVQAGTPFRMLPDNINHGMYATPLARWHRFLPIRLPMDLWFTATGTLQRHPVNGDLGEAAAGKSTGDAMKFMADLAQNFRQASATHGPDCRIRKRILKSGSRAICHFTGRGVPRPAALYESWSIPFSVMLVVPLASLAHYWPPICAA